MSYHISVHIYTLPQSVYINPINTHLTSALNTTALISISLCFVFTVVFQNFILTVCRHFIDALFKFSLSHCFLSLSKLTF